MGDGINKLNFGKATHIDTDTDTTHIEAVY